MPAHGKYGMTANVRWVYDGPAPDDGHWQMRCPDCSTRDQARWWDLTLEFWDHRSLQRCRACDRQRRRESDRRRATDDRKIAQRAYHHANKALINAKRTARRRAAKDPVTAS